MKTHAKENIMLKRSILVLLLGMVTFAIVGCEANAKVGDGKAKVEVKDN